MEKNLSVLKTTHERLLYLSDNSVNARTVSQRE